MRIKKGTVKKWMLLSHRWLGLLTAPIVFFVCFTGTIIVFADEIMDFSAGDARYVKEVKKQKLPTEELLDILKQEMPLFKHNYVVYYRNPERSVRINCFNRQEGLRMVYMDPYSGEILKADKTIYFFYIVAHLHHSFLLHKPGEWLVDIATIIFIIASITGLVLWWPKRWSKKHRKAVFSIKRNVPFRRINYDLHKVLGFYALAVGLLLAITGLLIAFKPLAAVTKNTFGGNAELSMKQVFMSQDTATTKTVVPINSVIADAFKQHPSKSTIQLKTFYLDEFAYYTMIAANHIGLKSAMNGELVAYDKVTGAFFDIPKELVKNNQVENVYWTLHMGNYMGLLGKILTFLAGLIASSLPITGFIIWKGNRK